VKTGKTSMGQLQDYLDLVGDVKAQTNVDIYPDVGGKLASVDVKVGDIIEKNQTVIAMVDPSKPGDKYALSAVYSPISGIVTSKPAEIGATVTTTTSITTVGDLKTLDVEVQVPEAQVAKVKKGQTAKLTLEAYPGIGFDAYVDRLYPVVDTTSRTKTVILNLKQADKRVNLGMYVNVQLLLDKNESRVIIPEDSIVTRNEQSWVFALGANNTVKKLTITKGLSIDGKTEILTGLTGSETLITEGQELLDEGSKVKIVNDQNEGKN
jgi:membrane fusion protein (multidrug efflux system)